MGVCVCVWGGGGGGDKFHIHLIALQCNIRTAERNTSKTLN